MIALTVLTTAALTVPFLGMQPTATSSQEPPGEVFEARDRVAERFASPTHLIVFVVEARDDDILDRDSLLELLEREAALRGDGDVAAKLAVWVDPETGREVEGLVTIADAVDGALRARGAGGLRGATEEQVGEEVSRLVSDAGPAAFSLSTRARRDEDTGRWSAPALTALVLADNEALGGGGAGALLGADDTTKEEYAREVQRLLRGDEGHNQVWGLAIDVNLTSAEQGNAAGPFIGLTLLAVILLLGLAFRSYWAMAVTGFGLGMLMIWLGGLSNLIGLKNDQILSIIVPIAMISFGVDFAFHAIGRYREELARGGTRPRGAFVVGLGSVMAALLVAMVSDSVAFLSNTTSGIESLIQFGIAASLATVSAFLVLGLFTPLVLSRIEDRLGVRPRTRGGVALSMAGGVAAALGAMATVVVSVFVLPWAGAVLLAGHGLLFLLLPAWLAARLHPGPAVTTTAAPGVDAGSGARLIGALVVGAARWRGILLPLLLIVTILAALGAQQVEARFDVRDFFAPTTDFVVALDRFDEHAGAQSGEPADIYVEADCTDPRTIAAIGRFRTAVEGLDTRRLACDAQGRVKIGGGVLEPIELVAGSPAARFAIAQRFGTTITDEDQDGVPDTREQLAALLSFARETGIPGGEPGELALRPDIARSLVWLEDSAGEASVPSATRLSIQIPGSRVQEQIEEARDLLEPLIADLEEDLHRHDPDARVVLTGGPIVRQASLDAILLAFRAALPLAVLLCLIVATVFMRSLRYAAASTVPVMVVAAWLYGFMYATGYSINVVTATIGAISIGVGIDFSVHFTMRFREELPRAANRLEALRAAGAGTGMALVGSAVSSAVGFAILAFAPMPMFATYGLLTAIMIVFALLSSLVVLPCLLMAVTPKAQP